MSFYSDYIAYIKNNPKQYWFKRKPYGWGWTPVTREGWLTVVVMVLAIVFDFLRIDSVSHSASDTLRPFFLHVVIIIAVFIAICYKKGEKPKWQWGFPKDEDTEN